MPDDNEQVPADEFDKLLEKLCKLPPEQVSQFIKYLIDNLTPAPVSTATLRWVFIMTILIREGGEHPLNQDDVDAIPADATYLIDQSSIPAVFRLAKKGDPGAEPEPESCKN